MTDVNENKQERRRVRGGDVASVGGSLATVVALLVGGRDVSNKLDAIQASLTKLESKIAVVESVRADERLRVLELGHVRLEGRVDVLEAKGK